MAAGIATKDSSIATLWIGADFGERGCDEALPVKGGGGNSVNEGFGKDFYRKGNSVNRSGPFSEPLESEN